MEFASNTRTGPQPLLRDIYITERGSDNAKQQAEYKHLSERERKKFSTNNEDVFTVHNTTCTTIWKMTRM
jgi:hypothetical protein